MNIRGSVAWRALFSAWRDESGQALVLTTVCLTLLMGTMALAIDVGYAQFEQRQLQIAADSAAIAAGLELGNCSNTVCANMKTAAAQALKEAGITTSTLTPTSSCTVSTSSSLAIVINVGPCVLGSTTNDPNYGNTHMAEVVLTMPVKTIFGAVIGIPTINLTARAEAGDSWINTANSGGNCLWAGSINFNTGATLDLNSCGVYDNGGLQTNNHASTTASDFLYYGSWSPNNCQTPTTCTWTLGSSETQPTHTTTAESDPLSGLTPPSKPATQDANNCSLSNQDCWGNNLTTAQQNGTAPISIPPGYYGGGINANTDMVLNFSPGLYYFGGTLNLNTGVTLECTTCTSGAGVTLYFASGSINMNSYATVELSAPATGNTASGTAVANMLIWESSTNSTTMITNTGSSSYYNGVIYLPDAQLDMNSNSGITNSGATATAIDVQSLQLNTGADIVINSSGGYLGGSSSQTLGSFALAE